MGGFLTFANSLFNPLNETVKTIVQMYRMEGDNLRGVIFQRVLIAKQIKNPNLSYIASLAKEDFLKCIDEDLAVFIFVLLMCEFDNFNKKFSKNPSHYFFKIETEVIKQLHTYKPNRDINYDLINILSIRYNRFRW